MISESDRKIRATNYGSFIITIDKKWAQSTNLKSGDSLKMMSVGPITMLVAPNSPALEPGNLEKLKAILRHWGRI